MRPLIFYVESLALVDARGESYRCRPEENRELFGLVDGGYGLFGVIYSVTLRLLPRRKLEWVVELITTNKLQAEFEERIQSGFLYGDF